MADRKLRIKRPVADVGVVVLPKKRAEVRKIIEECKKTGMPEFRVDGLWLLAHLDLIAQMENLVLDHVDMPGGVEAFRETMRCLLWTSYEMEGENLPEPKKAKKPLSLREMMEEVIRRNEGGAFTTEQLHREMQDMERIFGRTTTGRWSSAYSQPGMHHPWRGDGRSPSPVPISVYDTDRQRWRTLPSEPVPAHPHWQNDPRRTVEGRPRSATDVIAQERARFDQEIRDVANEFMRQRVDHEVLGGTRLSDWLPPAPETVNIDLSQPLPTFPTPSAAWGDTHSGVLSGAPPRLTVYPDVRFQPLVSDGRALILRRVPDDGRWVAVAAGDVYETRLYVPVTNEIPMGEQIPWLVLQGKRRPYYTYTG